MQWINTTGCMLRQSAIQNRNTKCFIPARYLELSSRLWKDRDCWKTCGVFFLFILLYFLALWGFALQGGPKICMTLLLDVFYIFEEDDCEWRIGKAVELSGHAFWGHRRGCRWSHCLTLNIPRGGGSSEDPRGWFFCDPAVTISTNLLLIFVCVQHQLEINIM